MQKEKPNDEAIGTKENSSVVIKQKKLTTGNLCDLKNERLLERNFNELSMNETRKKLV